MGACRKSGRKDRKEEIKKGRNGWEEEGGCFCHGVAVSEAEAWVSQQRMRAGFYLSVDRARE